MRDLERIELALAARLDPADVARMTVRARDTRIEKCLIAIAAFRQHELVFLEPVPIGHGFRRHRGG